MEKAMLTFDKVNAHYGKIQALHDVSLHINQGEIVTLIGANGAGKTTLLGTLCGDPRASSGQIVFDGKEITDWQTAKIMREAVAIVPEGRRVFSRMTVEENLAMGGFFAHRDQFFRAASNGYTNSSRVYGSAACSVPAPCPAANSRCWRLVVR
ncbi:high-affinity branched-chain amino acid transport ATP-binding protein LivF [Enterobacteriaceae bacterium ATCC 29904]|nr:high-affinity branched-chain amino acid transport ATP-binding protein LivF [Enterobacteriaceae bacterium ATCC 29904]